MQSKECRERVIELSKSQAAGALLIEMKSVGEKNHLTCQSSREVVKDPGEGLAV